MPNFDWIKKYLPDRGETKQNGTPPTAVDRDILVGLVPRGDTLIVVPPDSAARGVRLVTMPQSLKRRYEAADLEYANVQAALAKLPYSHRKRAPRKPKVAEPTE